MSVCPRGKNFRVSPGHTRLTLEDKHSYVHKMVSVFKSVSSYFMFSVSRSPVSLYHPIWFLCRYECLSEGERWSRASDPRRQTLICAYIGLTFIFFLLIFLLFWLYLLYILILPVWLSRRLSVPLEWVSHIIYLTILGKQLFGVFSLLGFIYLILYNYFWRFLVKFFTLMMHIAILYFCVKSWVYGSIDNCALPPCSLLYRGEGQVKYCRAILSLLSFHCFLSAAPSLRLLSSPNLLMSLLTQSSHLSCGLRLLLHPWCFSSSSLFANLWQPPPLLGFRNYI